MSGSFKPGLNRPDIIQLVIKAYFFLSKSILFISFFSFYQLDNILVFICNIKFVSKNFSKFKRFDKYLLL